MKKAQAIQMIVLIGIGLIVLIVIAAIFIQRAGKLTEGVPIKCDDKYAKKMGYKSCKPVEKGQCKGVIVDLKTEEGKVCCCELE